MIFFYVLYIATSFLANSYFFFFFLDHCFSFIYVLQYSSFPLSDLPSPFTIYSILPFLVHFHSLLLSLFNCAFFLFFFTSHSIFFFASHFPFPSLVFLSCLFFTLASLPFFVLIPSFCSIHFHPFILLSRLTHCPTFPAPQEAGTSQ